MSNVLFISDIHFGHKNIVKFGKSTGTVFRTGDCCIENMQHIIKNWNKKVTKRDQVFVLGDVAFSKEGFDALHELNGTKVLIRGNHDNLFSTDEYLKVFKSVEGIVRYKEFWLTHAPVHPMELRGKKNIHGHVHHCSIKAAFSDEYDTNYINVCCEALGETPISLEEIRNGTYNRIRKC